MKKYNIVMVLSAFLISTFSLPVFSGTDTKTYAGSTCSSANRNRTFVHRTDDGSIVHPETGFTMTWNCPIIKDQTIGSKITKASIYVIDDNPNGNIRCRLYSKAADGNYTYYSQVFSSGASRFPQIIKFTNVPGRNWGSYHINCFVPKHAAGRSKSSIISYVVNEKNN